MLTIQYWKTIQARIFLNFKIQFVSSHQNKNIKVNFLHTLKGSELNPRTLELIRGGGKIDRKWV
jgi:hypothetical protein